MLGVELNESKGVVILEPNDELSEDDFKAVARVIDPYIESAGRLKGIVIHVESFPGWDSFSSMVTHLRFVKDHHRKILRVAFVTDSPVGTIAEKVADHFVSARIKKFAFDELTAAETWILEGNE